MATTHSRLTHRGLIPALVLLIGLSACTRLPHLPDEPADEAAWQVHSEQLQRLQAWSLDGRVALRAPDDGWTASLQWSQWVDYMDFRLRGTFGIGTTRVRGSQDWMIIETSRGDVWETAHPEVELERLTGWRVPLAMLRWWMVGLPAPNEAPEERVVDGDGHLAYLEQGDWRVYYEDYAEYEGQMLPGRITVENEEVRLRIRIRDWLLGEEEPSERFSLPETDSAG